METRLWAIWDQLVSWFEMPGAAMMRSLASTSWGKEWGVPAEPDDVIVLGLSLLFWCIVFSLLGSMNYRVRQFLQCN